MVLYTLPSLVIQHKPGRPRDIVRYPLGLSVRGVLTIYSHWRSRHCDLLMGHPILLRWRRMTSPARCHSSDIEAGLRWTHDVLFHSFRRYKVYTSFSSVQKNWLAQLIHRISTGYPSAFTTRPQSLAARRELRNILFHAAHKTGNDSYSAPQYILSNTLVW